VVFITPLQVVTQRQVGIPQAEVTTAQPRTPGQAATQAQEATPATATTHLKHIQTIQIIIPVHTPPTIGKNAYAGVQFHVHKCSLTHV